MSFREHIIKFSVFIKDNLVRVNLAISLVLNILLWVAVWYFVKPQIEPYLLHYNIFLGIDLIGEWWRMYLLPGIGLGIIIVNFILSWILLVREKILSYFLMVATSIAQVFLIFGLIFILLLNN